MLNVMDGTKHFLLADIYHLMVRSEIEGFIS